MKLTFSQIHFCFSLLNLLIRTINSIKYFANKFLILMAELKLMDCFCSRKRKNVQRSQNQIVIDDHNSFDKLILLEYYNIFMFSKTFLLIIFFLNFIFIENTTFNSQTLQNLLANSQYLLDSSQYKALSFLMQTNPELSSYYVNTLTVEPNSTPTLKGYEVNLTSPTLKRFVNTIITISNDQGSHVVSFNAVDNTTPSNLLNNNKNMVAAGQANTQIQTQKSTLSRYLSPPPGAYTKFTNFKDPFYKAANSYLLKIHPNLQNYKMLGVSAQIVAGFNFLFNFISNDGLSLVNSKVYVNLQQKAQLLEFNITSNPANSQSYDNLTSSLIYYAQEFVLLQHPELSSYLISSVDLEENLDNSILVMITFDNIKLLLRSLAEVRIDLLGNSSIQSYYTYSTVTS